MQALNEANNGDLLNQIVDAANQGSNSAGETPAQREERLAFFGSELLAGIR